ncbi:MAG: VanZ family protein [Betaproteobacteria bacterium]|nr:VanZ family protein [Betaproteobacteria bacterium]
MAPRRSAALPLACLYAGLIVYASLYPFEGWREQGLVPWSFLWAPWPRYWTGFDVVSNVLGYGPLGFLVSLAVQRLRPAWPAVRLTMALALCLSMAMESLQMFLPARVPSNVDLLLNVAGACMGAVLARALESWGVIGRWSRFRDRWFVSESSGALVLLALWPLALQFPVAVPFGLGQVYERAETEVLHRLADTPWIDWLPMRDLELQPLLPVSEWLCITVGLMLPCLLAFSVLRSLRQRLIVSSLGLGLGVAASTLSAALTYGPGHAWDWIGYEVWMGLAMAAVALGVLLRHTARSCLVVALVLLVWQLVLLNQASADVYFAQTLQHWEQGRFIRFHGLIQWLGWLWPYALLWHLVRRLASARSPA